MDKVENIDQHIKSFPESTQKKLEQLRETIQKAAPEAKETISYGIPTFTLEGNLVHFAGYKNHIGFYPGAEGIEAFKEELSGYKGAKGSVQFPLDKPLPLKLVAKIVKYRVIKNKSFLTLLSAPAMRALESKNIKTLKRLSEYSEKEILALHGMGPSSIPKLRLALKEAGLSFKKPA